MRTLLFILTAMMALPAFSSRVMGHDNRDGIPVYRYACGLDQSDPETGKPTPPNRLFRDSFRDGRLITVQFSPEDNTKIKLGILINKIHPTIPNYYYLDDLVYYVKFANRDQAGAFKMKLELGLFTHITLPKINSYPTSCMQELSFGVYEVDKTQVYVVHRK